MFSPLTESSPFLADEIQWAGCFFRCLIKGINPQSQRGREENLVPVRLHVRRTSGGGIADHIGGSPKRLLQRDDFIALLARESLQ